MHTWNDPVFPGLSMALDPDAVLTQLLSSLREEVQLSGVSISNIYYDPGVYCRVLYSLDLRKAGSESSTKHLVFASLLKAGEQPGFPPIQLSDRYRNSGEQVLRLPYFYVPDLHAMFYSFPIDPSLPWLMDALDSNILKQKLNRLLEHHDPGGSVREVSAQILRYKPKARATILYDMKMESNRERQLVGKLYMENRYRNTSDLYAGTLALLHAAGTQFGLASLVGFISPLRLILQEYMNGKFLSQWVHRPSLMELVRETAVQVAALHHLSFPLSRYRSPTHEASVVFRGAKTLKIIRPDLMEWIESLSSKICSEIERCTQMKAPVHGDLQYKNILVSDKGITFIDLDDISYGDPVLDIGHFIASLRISGMGDAGKAARLADVEEVFLGEYLRHVPEKERRIQLFLAASLFRMAANAFRGQRPQWQERIQSILEEVERVLHVALRSVTDFPVSIGRRKQEFSFQERKQWSLDGTYVEALLDPYIEKLFGVELTSCRPVVKQETEERCQIEYALSGWLTDERWSSTVQGIVGRKHGSGYWYRLREMHLALKERNNAPLLPLPIAYFPQLNLMIVKPPPARIPFSTLIGTSRFVETAGKVGRALASFHHASVRTRSVHPLTEELSELREKTEKLEIRSPDFANQARILFPLIEQQMKSIPERAAPILRQLQPSTVFCDNGQIAFPELEMHVFTHPFVGLSAFLARLTLLGFEVSREKDVAEAVDCLLQSYLTESGINPHGLVAFEAAAALNLACTQAQVHSGGATAKYLLQWAEGLLGQF